MTTAGVAVEAEIDLDPAVHVLAGRRIAVLTGAGVSTDSGIPDYRSPDSPAREPMSFDRFRDDAAARRRYWAGGQLGWRRFGSARPNAGHRAVARLEEAGVVTGVVTQNVDALHSRAGSRRVVGLHGTMHRVVCLRCGQVFAREEIGAWIEARNPWLAAIRDVVAAPDGDAEVADASRLIVPDCPACGGMLKPEVVFFGELVPLSVFALARSVVAGAEALLVAGSSLAVNSAVRVVEAARRRGLPLVIVNRGPTRRDDAATVRITGGTSPVLSGLADRLLDRPARPRTR